MSIDLGTGRGGPSNSSPTIYLISLVLISANISSVDHITGPFVDPQYQCFQPRRQQILSRDNNQMKHFCRIHSNCINYPSSVEIITWCMRANEMKLHTNNEVAKQGIDFQIINNSTSQQCPDKRCELCSWHRAVLTVCPATQKNIIQRQIQCVKTQQLTKFSSVNVSTVSLRSVIRIFPTAGTRLRAV